MGVLDTKLMRGTTGAALLDERFAALDPQAVMRLAVKDLFQGRIALVTFDPARNALVLRSAGDRERSGS